MSLARSALIKTISTPKSATLVWQELSPLPSALLPVNAALLAPTAQSRQCRPHRSARQRLPVTASALHRLQLVSPALLGHFVHLLECPLHQGVHLGHTVRPLEQIQTRLVCFVPSVHFVHPRGCQHLFNVHKDLTVHRQECQLRSHALLGRSAALWAQTPAQPA